MKEERDLKRGLWLVGSALLQALVLALMLQAMLVPRGFMSLFRRAEEPVTVVNLPYVVPVAPVVPVIPPRTTQRITAPTVRIVPAPRTVPAIIPALPTGPVAVAPPDTGAARGTGAPASGGTGLPALNPSNPDPRLYNPGAITVGLPKPTGLAGIERSLDSTIRAKRDSVSRITNPMDWTVTKGDKKYGLDPTWIYLGKLKLPTMLLGFIPLKGVQGNPGAYDRSKTIGAMAAEARKLGPTIAAQRGEIASINARTERERNKRLAAAGGGKVPP